MIRTQNLTQEDPQRNQRRIDPIQPAHIDCCQCLRDDPLGEHIAERQISVLKKLTSQKSHLLPKPSLARISHPWASLPVMDVLPNTIYAREAFFAYVTSSYGLAGDLRAIRHIDRSIKMAPENRARNHSFAATNRRLIEGYSICRAGQP